MAIQTPVTRVRRPVVQVEPTLDTAPARVIFNDDGNEAQVTEQIGGKTVQYTAKVKQDDPPDIDDDSELDDEDLSFEDDLELEIQAVPDSPLEVMFKQIRGAVSQGLTGDNLLAMITRNPDPMGMRFNNPNSVPFMSLGAFQFTSRDMFRFDEAIQERNKNSGGVFNIKIYKVDNTPLMIRRNKYAFEQRGGPEFYEIGLMNYPVPDPNKVDAPNAPGSNIENMMLQYMEKTENRFEAMLQQMNRPKEQSTLEKAMEQKMLNDLLHPKENAGGMDAFQNMMMSMAAAPIWIEKMTNRMFPEPAAPVEPDTLEKITNLLGTPAAEKVLGGFMAMSQQFAANKFATQANANTIHNPQPAAPVEQTASPEQQAEMRDLILNLIDQLESDEPLNGENEFIKDLQMEYPTQAGTLTAMCKGASFEMVVQMLVMGAGNLVPNPLDVFITDNTWNERGAKLVIRLEEFYNHVKTLS